MKPPSGPKKQTQNKPNSNPISKGQNELKIACQKIRPHPLMLTLTPQEAKTHRAEASAIGVSLQGRALSTLPYGGAAQLTVRVLHFALKTGAALKAYIGRIAVMFWSKASRCSMPEAGCSITAAVTG